MYSARPHEGGGQWGVSSTRRGRCGGTARGSAWARGMRSYTWRNRWVVAVGPVERRPHSCDSNLWSRGLPRVRRREAREEEVEGGEVGGGGGGGGHRHTQGVSAPLGLSSGLKPHAASTPTRTTTPLAASTGGTRRDLKGSPPSRQRAPSAVNLP